MIKNLFTLLLLVVGVGVAVPQSRAKIVERATPAMDAFKSRVVPSRLEAMANQLVARVNRGEGLPSSWEGWLRREFTGSELDPWDNVYFFETRRGVITVGSMGPDGVRGTPDDLTHQRRLP